MIKRWFLTFVLLAVMVFPAGAATTMRTGSGMFIAAETLTIEAAAYASGDLVGGKITISPPAPGRRMMPGLLIQSVVITDLAEQSVNLDVIFFDADPSNTTFTENAPLDIADADLVNIIAVVHITDWSDFADNSQGQAINLALPALRASSNMIYAAIVVRGAPTYASTSDLTIKINMLVY